MYCYDDTGLVPNFYHKCFQGRTPRHAQRPHFFLLLGVDSLVLSAKVSTGVSGNKGRLHVFVSGLETGHCYKLGDLDFASLSFNHVPLGGPVLV